MARLHEYQGKELLKQFRIPVPKGGMARTPERARQIAEEIGGELMVKAQAWVTGRADKGGIRFAETREQAEADAADLLAMTLGHFPVTEVLVEQALDIRDELFVSLAIDDEAEAPVLLLEAQGGTGIEQRAEGVQHLPVDVRLGIDADRVRSALGASPVAPKRHDDIVATIERLGAVGRSSGGGPAVR